MPGRIPQTFIDDLLARTDLVDIVGGYVSLRKGGKNFLGLCPFHDEKTPSFTVSQDKQFYHCFGCGANGTAIGFLMEFGRMEFVEAVEDLAHRAGLEVPREGGAAPADRGLTELYELLELVVGFYRARLKDHPDAGRARDYLKSRGLTGELAARYELGYAPPGWDNLITQMGRSGEARARLLEAGMIIKRDGGDGGYDRFRDRIIYPIRDYRGRVIGFGGRTLGDDTPKYLNSPETPVFHKGRELYGLYQARQDGRQLQQVYVVEGYMDVLALAQFDIPNAVATLGVAATEDHLNRLFRYTGQIVFCFDGDEAGRKAAWRALEIALPSLTEGRQVYFLFMPDGLDPDDFVRRHGREDYLDPARRVPLSDYLIDTLKAGNDLNTREGRSRLLEQASAHLTRLPHTALRQLLLEDVAGIARTPVNAVESLLPETHRKPKKQYLAKSGSGPRTPVTLILELVLHHPDLAARIPDPAELGEFPVPGVEFLRQLVELVHARPGINCAGIIENWRGTRYERRLREIAASSDERVSQLTDPAAELEGAMELLRRQRDKHIRRKLSNISRMGDLSEEDRDRLRKPRG